MMAKKDNKKADRLTWGKGDIIVTSPKKGSKKKS